jgi:glycosyltransferase involved in cell wall biosynthesis
MAKIIVSVISDLVTDQRVHKVSQTLHEMGYDVLLVGTKKSKSQPLQSRDYSTKRISMLFQKGFLFYAEWNIRLFFYLLFKKAPLLLANDLDTLPPNYFVATLKGSIVIYDTHEFFTETAELYNRDFVKRIWIGIEDFFFPRVKYIYTVNNSLADLYKQKYNKDLKVVRNLPLLQTTAVENAIPASSFSFPADKKILLLQGNGINENRGAEEFVLAAKLINNAFILVIAGNGLIIERLKTMVAANNLQQKVFFTGVLPFQQLQNLTRLAYCGFSLDKPLNINQQASLPNKLFDYLASDVPVIVSNIKEVAKIVGQYQTGIVIEDVTPEKIAAAVHLLDADGNRYLQFKANTRSAINELNWNNEKHIIEDLFKKIIAENKLIG